MQVEIIENIKTKLKVIIHCSKIDDDVLKLKNYIEQFDNKIKAKKDNQTYFININSVLYFESVDNNTFLYTECDVMQIKYRLYELEKMLCEKDFIRISKSQIVNINKINSLKPEINRTILATMCNGECLHISRKYVKKLLDMLSIRGNK